MLGSLQEIDPTSLLQLIEIGQRSGTLQITVPGKTWLIFFSHGKISYATGNDPFPQRLQDYLTPCQCPTIPAGTPNTAGITPPEYAFLWKLIQENSLTPQQVSNILQEMILEILFDIIELPKGTFIFKQGATLYPPLPSYLISHLVNLIHTQRQTWHNYFPYIQSPHQCPRFLHLVPLEGIETWIDGKTSLRRLSRLSGLSFSTTLLKIYEAITAGWLAMKTFIPPLSLPAQKIGKRVVCIDDSVTVCRTVEYILQGKGYQVTAIVNPVRALSLLFQLKPDLILCDIVMPELDGYDLCAMLRKSHLFIETPIVMLTSKDGFLDRVYAELVGASTYITKPFGEKELLAAVDAYLSI